MWFKSDHAGGVGRCGEQGGGLTIGDLIRATQDVALNDIAQCFTVYLFKGVP